MPSARRKRWLRLIVATAVAVTLAHFGGRRVLASAIADAPNHATRPLAASAVPAELAGFRTEELTVEVGPPRATLSAWVVEPRGAAALAATALVLHGVRSDKTAMARVGAELARAGHRAVLVDLRGHGASSGDFLTYGVQESRDLMQLLDALSRRGLPSEKAAVYGFSYGGAVGIQLAARDARIGAVVAVSTFSTLRDAVFDYARCYLPFVNRAIPDVWLQGAVDEAGVMAAFDPDQASTLSAVRGLRTPVLLIHGALDTQVPAQHSEALKRVAGERSRLVVIPGETHGSMPGDRTGTVRRETLDWYRRWLTRE